MMLAGSSADVFVGYRKALDANNVITVKGVSLKAKMTNLTLAAKTQSAAKTLINNLSGMINAVSSMRSDFGAIQNRLEHTVDNLDNIVENVTASESRIRDTDMADEMVKYSKNNILTQAGQSMLAQANQSTQGVLSLLQ